MDELYDTASLSYDRKKIESIIFRIRMANDFARGLLSQNTSPIAQLLHRKWAKSNLKSSLEYELPDVRVHHAKLDQYMTFLPGTSSDNIDVGSLLSCSGSASGNRLQEVRDCSPSSRAMFLHKLNPVLNEYTMGDVRSLAFLPNNDVVVLTGHGKKVSVFLSLF